MAACRWCKTDMDVLMATGRHFSISPTQYQTASHREPVAVACSTSRCPTVACEYHAASYFRDPGEGEPVVCMPCYLRRRRAALAAATQ